MIRISDPELTARRDSVVDALKQVIRSAPPALLDTIADYDTQAMAGDTPKHRAALDTLIQDYDCVLSKMPDSGWYPREPIGLASYGVDRQDDIVTAFACCFLLIDDLVDRRMGYMHFRLSDSPGRAFFDRPPDRFRLPLLEGIAVYDALESLEPL